MCTNELLEPNSNEEERLPSDASAIWGHFAGKHVLLLQGPMGPFFRHVAKRLKARGARVSKVNLNVADAVYYLPLPNGSLYRGSLREWPEFLTGIITARAVTSVMLFGDCRPYHRAAIDCAQRLGVEVYVFEEGYLRPNFVTLERGGVNGHSRLPRDPGFYCSLNGRAASRPAHPNHTFALGAVHSINYALILSLLGWLTPRYVHHRDLNALRQGWFWLRGALLRLSRTARDRRVERELKTHRSEYFLVPLQVHLDSQISHSTFRDVTEFIEIVVRSFAQHAAKTSTLVLKGHPLDLPYRDYTSLVEKLRHECGLGERIKYVDVVNLSELLRTARGTVVINSTVGLSSLMHSTPTICLGRAIYDLPGLTYQGSLDDFWTATVTVDSALLEKFVTFVKTETQLAGNVSWGLAN